MSLEADSIARASFLDSWKERHYALQLLLSDGRNAGREGDIDKVVCPPVPHSLLAVPTSRGKRDRLAYDPKIDGCRVRAVVSDPAMALDGAADEIASVGFQNRI